MVLEVDEDAFDVLVSDLAVSGEGAECMDAIDQGRRDASREACAFFWGRVAASLAGDGGLCALLLRAGLGSASLLSAPLLRASLLCPLLLRASLVCASLVCASLVCASLVCASLFCASWSATLLRASLMWGWLGRRGKRGE